MSIQAVGYVLDHSPSRGLRRLVLISIANHANRFGANCHPSIELIAAEAGVGRATAFRAIDDLERDGELLIRRARGRGHRSAYVLVMGRDAEACCVLFDDPEACLERQEPRPRGRPKKVSQRNDYTPEKVSQRNDYEREKVSQRNKKGLTADLLVDDKSSIKGLTTADKSSIPSRALRSIEGTVKEPLQPSSSTTAREGKEEEEEEAKKVLNAFCEITGAEFLAMPTATIEAQERIAARLLGDYSPPDIDGCMRWLRTWRRLAWSLETVGKEIDEWIAKGRPTSGTFDPPPRPNGAAQTTVSRADGAAQRRIMGRD